MVSGRITKNTNGMSFNLRIRSSYNFYFLSLFYKYIIYYFFKNVKKRFAVCANPLKIREREHNYNK